MTHLRFFLFLTGLIAFSTCPLPASAQQLSTESHEVTERDEDANPQFRVLHGSGEPVAGATVRLIRQTQTYRELVQFNVLHETKTDDDGFFRLPLGLQVANAEAVDGGFSATWVTVPARDRQPQRTWLLGTSSGAYSPYMELIYSMIEKPAILESPAEGWGDPKKIPSTYRLPEWKTVVRAVNSDGSPADGVAVTPIQIVWLSKGQAMRPIFVPPQLRSSMRRVTNADGEVILTTIAKWEVAELEFESKQHGRQRTFSNANSIGDVLDRSVMLFPTGAVRGTINTRNDREREFLDGKKLLFTSALTHSGLRRPRGKTIEMHGCAEVTVDENGHFEIPKMAMGRLTRYDRADKDETMRVTFPTRIVVQPDQTTEAQGSVISTVLVHGVLLKRDSGIPVPKAAVSVRHGIQAGLTRELTVYATTDQFGRFQARVYPGVVGYSSITVIPGYVTVYPWEQSKVPANQVAFTPRGQRATVPGDVQQWELPPLEVVPTLTLTGRLIDAAGQPVPNTRIYAYSKPDQTNCGSADTDVNGDFKMERIPSTHPPRFFRAALHNKTVPLAIDSQDPLVLEMTSK